MIRRISIIAAALVLAVPALAYTAPVPRQKPQRTFQTPAWPDGNGGWSAASVKEAREMCGGLLKGLDVTYRRLEPIGNEGGCGAPAPIELSSVAGVAIVPPATVTCDVAYGLHQWVSASVQPAARRLLKTEVTTIHTAASYVCRSRNGVAGAKLSEHGHANAFDMSGFSFAKKGDVAMGGGWGGVLQSIGLSRGGSFLGTVREDACSYFATVLGPGSDAYHGNHFHVDAIRRKNGYRICH